MATTDINNVIVVGRLTRDPELSYTNNEKALAKFSIANNQTYRKDDNVVSKVSFFNIVVWGNLAKVCQEYLSKGKQVCVSGRLQQRRWEAPDGSNRNAVEIVANSVQFFGGGRSALGSEPPEEARAAAAAVGGEIQGSEDYPEDVPF